jgi:RimJ/RimL family protein N-acetyltransferase
MKNQFSSNRLIISDISLNDFEFIFHLVNSPGWLEFIGDRKVYDFEDAKLLIQKIIEDPLKTYWVVKLKDSETSVGVVSFIQRSFLKFPDIGFAFLPQFNGQGYALEATKTVIEGLKINSEHPEIQALTLPHNHQSIRLLLKLGFVFENEIENNDEKLSLYRKTL